jgi:hypothetical protein
MAGIGQPDNCRRVGRRGRASTECFMFTDVIAAVVAASFAASSSQTTITPKMTEFDLQKAHHRDATCADRSPSDEIIVCAPKNMNIWISDADKASFVPKPLRREFVGPLNSETTLHIIQSPNPMAVTPAAVVTFKWHF